MTLSKVKTAERVRRAEQIVGHEFADQNILVAAITHPSAAEYLPVWASYERLEFLGDSILGAIVATALYEKFPEMDEGGLSRLKISLVSGYTLSDAAGKQGIGDLIIFGESEKGTGARGMHSALENVYESLVGALYLDGGYEAAHAFVLRTLEPYMVSDIARMPVSPKSRFQEVIQRDYKMGPTYKLVETKGPAHAPTFVSVALVDGVRRGRGEGPTKKESEAAAASDALIRMGYQEGTTPADDLVLGAFDPQEGEGK